MLTHPTLDLLHQLGLNGMAKAFGDIEASDEATSLSHPEWLALLLDREASYRSDRRLHARLRYAKLRHQAAVEDVDYRVARGLDRALFQKLAEGAWIDAHDNLILCGPTGVGKSWLASALGHKACRDNRSVLYQRIPKLFADLALARGDGRYARIQRALGGVQLLILDDWGLEPLDAVARHDLLEILEERYGRRSTLINPAWDRAVEQSMLHEMQLPPSRKIGHLSHGMRVKLALVAALAFHPRLLVLDEPFAGLDPLVRDELLGSLRRRGGTLTILISSHELVETEGLATHVGLMSAGRLVFQESLDTLTARCREVSVTLEATARVPDPHPSHWLQTRAEGHVLMFTDTQFARTASDALIRTLCEGVRHIDARPMSLRSIFTALAAAARDGVVS